MAKLGEIMNGLRGTILMLLMFCVYGQEQDNICFHNIYPFNSFKRVVDTCMRAYTDVLILHDQIALQQKSDEQLDLLVGRLMRLQSYIEQLINAYRLEATITMDELDYLLQMITYLELTIDENEYKSLAQGLNCIMQRLKNELKQALGLLSYCTSKKELLFPCLCPRITDHSHRFV